jgi:hypothetical protein
MHDMTAEMPQPDRPAARDAKKDQCYQAFVTQTVVDDHAAAAMRGAPYGCDAEPADGSAERYPHQPSVIAFTLLESAAGNFVRSCR